MSPPPGPDYPHTFFEQGVRFPLQPTDISLNLRNAWWLADASFLAYASAEVVKDAFARTGIPVQVEPFIGPSTQCFVITASDWMVLAFRGSQVDRFWDVVRDWAVNIKVLPVPDEDGHLVHQGFLSGLAEVWNNVSTHIRGQQRVRRRPLWITGHSLGAALGLLAAGRCAHDPELGLTGVYTYGAPKVGDLGFAASITVPVFRFRHNLDIVARLPPGSVLAHAGSMQFIDSAGEIRIDSGAMAEWLLDARIAASNLWTSWLHPLDPLSLPRFLADHAPINYSILIWNIFERTP